MLLLYNLIFHDVSEQQLTLSQYENCLAWAVPISCNTQQCSAARCWMFSGKSCCRGAQGRHGN